ncbi:hypothetical protein BKA01_003841 [Pseudonocardia eucalypti]|uniref:hypothetical protein n=1 Tax=Pseudonocardia eucalypti TaxID=648755 RepID=UPI00161895DF|nr:hypothetical protein [Pseudonocardia eucalypti]
MELPDLSPRRSARQRLAVAAGALVAAGSVGAAAALFGHVEHGPAGDTDPYPAGPSGGNTVPRAAPPPAGPGKRARPAPRRAGATPVLAVLAAPTDDAVKVTPPKADKPDRARSWPVREDQLPRPRRVTKRSVGPLDGVTGTLSDVTGTAGDVVGLVGGGEPQPTRHRARSGSSDSVSTLRAREGAKDRDDYPRHRSEHRHGLLDPLGLF